MVVVGADVHKRTHTFVAVDEVGRALGHKVVNEVPPLFWRLLILVHWIREGVDDVTAEQVPGGVPGTWGAAV